jgi:hypothetical protein
MSSNWTEGELLPLILAGLVAATAIAVLLESRYQRQTKNLLWLAGAALALWRASVEFSLFQWAVVCLLGYIALALPSPFRK